MIIRSHSLIVDQSKSPHYKENLLPALAENNDENFSKKIKIDSSKIEQTANFILEKNHNKNIDKGSNFLHIHSIIKPLSDKFSIEKESLLQAIDCDSEGGNAYYKLAKLLENDETIELLNGEIYTSKELYLKAIQLNPQHENSYYNLANLLEDDETIKLLNGAIYTNKELYLKAIQLNPQDADFYYGLASSLENSETVEFLNGKFYTSKELYLKAIQLNPQDADFYYGLASSLENSETVEFLNGKIYTNKELYLKAIQLNPQDADFYYSLASSLENSETVEFLNGKIYTNKELYLKAIQLNPKNAILYYNIACLLENNETVELLNGKIYTSKELYLKAIQLNPKNAMFYCNFANLLKNHETIKLLNGEIYTNKKLYLKSTQLDPKNAIVYSNLAYLLKNNETIKLLNGEIYTKKELYLKAAQLDPKNAILCFNLACLLENDETVKFLNGKIYTKKELYLKAIQLDPKNAQSYAKLAYILQDDETIKLLSGKIYTKKGLYLKAIELDPKNAQSYAKLAYILQDDETIKLLSGKIYTKKGLYLKAIELDPKNAMLYYNLTYLLKNKEKVKLLSGEIYTKKELYLKVVDLQSIESLDPQAQRYLQQIYAQEIEKNPNNIEGYFGLISIIQNNTVSLKNKKKADIEFLFKEALHLDPTFAFSPRFAPHFFSVASHFFHKTTALLQELSTSFAIEDEFLRAKLLKEGASLTLKNGEVISTKTLYQHALPFLSSAYLKRKGNEGVGDYLSLRKYTVLQDGIKLTKLQAYTYVYQNNPAQYILTKIGDALHPEERILLRGKFYDKRTCYEEAKSDDSDAIALLKWTESLYPHEQLRKKELFHHVLKKVHQCYKARLEPYTVLARILSQFELTGSDSKDLCIFEKSLKEWSLTKNKKSIRFVSRRYGNSDDLDISDELYFTKKREFLLELLKYRPSCEEAYVALATSFQNPLNIHEKSYTSKEALYLKAIDINPEYSLPRFLLGKELFNQNIENIQLLNGMILSCKQLFMRAIQLGTYEAEAYHLAALMMDDREGILLFDEKTILSRGDLFVRAFELDFTRIMDLINFISYAKRRKSFHLNVDY